MKHIKIILTLSQIVLLVTALIVLAACGDAPAQGQTDTDEAAALELTVDELAEYNGMDGQPAYIAVDGVIYDVSNVSQWKNGQHNGFSAGKDLTEEIKTKSPHGISKLTGLPVVGTLKP